MTRDVRKKKEKRENWTISHLPHKLYNRKPQTTRGNALAPVAKRPRFIESPPSEMNGKSTVTKA